MIDIQKKKTRNRRYLDEEDFYPPQDDRVFKSGMDDVEDGDTFEEYVHWFYDMYEEDLFDPQSVVY